MNDLPPRSPPHLTPQICSVDLLPIIDACPDPIFLKDADCRILLANRATLAAIGKPAEAVLGKTDDAFFNTPASGRPVISNDQRIMDSGQSETIEICIPCPVGPRTFLSTKSPYRDSNGRIIGTIGIAHDITERKQSELQLKHTLLELTKAQDELVRKERLATLDKLVGSLAHELRTPLSVIHNCVYYLEKTTPPENAIVSDVLGDIEHAISSTDDIIGQMLDYAHEPSHQSSAFPIGEAIAQALARVPRPQNVRLVCSGEEPDFKLHANLNQIIRILAILIQNAVQAMPGGGDLKISLDRIEPHKVRVCVRDTGCGIPKEYVTKIFDPLFSTKTRGIGLGLAVAQRYAELNGGRLWVECMQGNGAAFHLVLRRLGSEASSQSHSK